MTPDDDDFIYAWCFDHGRLHRFPATDVPWCTAAWVWLAGDTEQAALADKTTRYGDAQYLWDLTTEQQLAVIDLREIQ